MRGSLPKGNAAKLLEETNEAYYWAGFIAADGCIVNYKRLSVGVSIKDKKHILKLAKFLNCKNICYLNSNNFPMVSLSLQDPPLISKFASKFNFKPRKTYNPPNLTWLKGDKFLSFFAGFVDGDGSFSLNGRSLNSIKFMLHGHASWKNNFLFIGKRLHELFDSSKLIFHSRVFIDKEGYVYLDISNFPFLRALKSKIISLSIPILKRKWDKISNTYVTRFEKHDVLKAQYIKLLNLGCTHQQISKKLHIHMLEVSRFIYMLKKNGYWKNPICSNKRSSLD
jgi:hypothetical protein